MHLPCRFTFPGIASAALFALASGPGAAPARGQAADAPTGITWKRVAIDPAGAYLGEKTAAADLNKDGLIDIIASNWWYQAPAWKKHRFRAFDATAYRTDYAMDVDGDGWMDVVSAGPAGLDWWRNPGKTTDRDTSWALMKSKGDRKGHHQGSFRDIDGDGKAEEFISNKPETEWFSHENGGFVSHFIDSAPTNYGDGAGDVNGDGRPDIIKPAAWFEGPADPRNGTWIKHPIAIGAMHQDSAGSQVESEYEWLGKNGMGQHGHTAEIYVYDVNQDGLPDLVCSSAHRWGLFWNEQYLDKGVRKFREHVIDSTQSELHSLALADIDGDGDMDLVTGKRLHAHPPGKDPGDNMPPFVAWYELIRAGKGSLPGYVRHFIDYGRDASSGQKVTVIDIDGDGDQDVIVASKSSGGSFLFLNQGISAGQRSPGPRKSDPNPLPDAFSLAAGSLRVTGWKALPYSLSFAGLNGGLFRQLEGHGPCSFPLEGFPPGPYLARGVIDGRPISTLIAIPRK